MLAFAILHIVLCVILAAIQVHMFENNGKDKLLWVVSILFFLVSLVFYMQLDESVSIFYNWLKS